MNIKKNRLANTFPYFLSFVIPVIIFSIGLFSMKFFGLPRSILFQDPNNEFVPMLSYLRRCLTGEENIFYSLSSGMGMSTFSMLAFYVFSPFNLLVIFFPADKIAYAFLLIIVLKFGCTGLTAYIFFKQSFNKKNKFLLILPAIAYACSAYMLGYFFHFEFTDAVILLPIVCLGINRIVDGKKPWLYIFSLGLTILIQYYMGFMVCIFSVIWFIYQMIISNKNKKEFINISKKFAIASICAGALSCATLIPAVIGTFSGTNRINVKNFNFESQYNLFDIFKQFTSNSEWGVMPLIFTGTVITFLFVLYFLNNNISKKEKIISVVVFLFLIFSSNIQSLNLIWHGGTKEQGAPFRWSFCIVFFTTYLACKSLININFLKRKFILLFPIIYIFIYLLSQNNSPLNEYSNILMYTDFIIVILISILLLRCNNKKYYKIIFATELINLAIFSIFNFAILGRVESGLSSFKTTSDNISKINDAVEKIYKYDTSIYRTEKTFLRSRNDGMTSNYNGVSLYSSIKKKACSTFHECNYSLNTVNSNAVNGILVFGDNNTSTITTLYGIKYLITNKGQKLGDDYEYRFSTDSFDIYEYKKSLSLAYVVNSSTFDDNTFTNDFEFLNKIARNSVDMDDDIFKKINNNMITKQTDNLYYQNENYTKYSEDFDGVITYTINNPGNKNIYYYSKSTDKNQKYIGERTNIQTSEVLKIDNSGNEIHIANLFGSGNIISLGNDSKITIKIKLFTESLYLLDENFYWEDSSNFNNFYSKISSQETSLKKDDNKMNSFIINTNVIKDNQTLLLTLPFENGWNVEVDGEKKQIKNMDGLIGIDLSQGVHVVKIYYKTPGLIIGLTISAITIISLILFIIAHRRQQPSR